MIFERITEPGLSQYAYAIGCRGAKEIAIVDPMRDIDVYLDFAGSHGVEITEVLETHIHADYASGARELAERTGATLRLSPCDHSIHSECAINTYLARSEPGCMRCLQPVRFVVLGDDRRR